MTHSHPGNAEVQAGLDAIRKQKWPQQYESIRHLIGSLSPSADLILLTLLDSRAPHVREAALKALAERSEVLGRIAARAALEDTCDLVRNASAEILGEVGTRQDVRRLTHALQDADWVVRASAADSLGRIGGKAALPVLKKATTQDANPIVRRDAAFALSYAGQEAVVPDLEQALAQETQEQAKVGLLGALYVLGRQERLPALLGLLQSEDSSVRHAVINSLSEIVRPENKEQAIQAVHDMLKHESNPGLKIDAQKAIEILSSAATSR